MTAFVVNGNDVFFAHSSDSEYVEIRDDVDVDAIINDMLSGDSESFDEAAVRVVSVMTLASIADAAVKYLREQVAGNHEGYVRQELVDLLVMAKYGSVDDLEDDESAELRS